jgi:UDP-N-acetylglucosamine--N-acetylmuramyl-(pentapeptide) pyrophosphoryl-undecaprenol N-acetylglucosamine transferase
LHQYGCECGLATCKGHDPSVYFLRGFIFDGDSFGDGVHTGTWSQAELKCSVQTVGRCMNRLVVLAAGGTGGHLFPAQALAETLIKRGYQIHLMTDERVHDYGKSFPADETHVVPSASPGLSDPLRLPSRLLKLYRGYRSAKSILRKLKPLAVVGFGGYPSFPPIYAASALGIPSIVHEQNAVLGRANKMLAKKVDRVAGSFSAMVGLPAEAVDKLVVTGNPVRAIALQQKAAVYPKFGAKFRLLVFGGSQGARFFSDFLPLVFAELRSKVSLTQQCRAEDIERVRASYGALGVTCDLQSFFSDMPKHIANSHLVICRSGASTIAELGVIGRPAIMVPLPHAIDNDQLRNAQSFAGVGGGWVCPQKELVAPDFAQYLGQLMSDEAGLKRAAESALSHGNPDAAMRLADLVEKIIQTETQ